MPIALLIAGALFAVFFLGTSFGLWLARNLAEGCRGGELDLTAAVAAGFLTVNETKDWA